MLISIFELMSIKNTIQGFNAKKLVTPIQPLRESLT